MTIYETKTVKMVEQGGPTEVSVMLTAFDAGNNEALNSRGYRGSYVMFTILDGATEEASYDPRKLRDVSADGGFREQLVQIKRGYETGGKAGIHWGKIQDGDEITF